MDSPTIAITGGSGFVGNAVAEHLAGAFRVKILDQVPPVIEREQNVKFSRCDVADSRSVRENLRDVDLVLHMAIVQIPRINENKSLAYQVNFVGTQNVCEAVASLSRPKGLILSSSWHVYGERHLNGTIDEASGFRPADVEERARIYAVAKVAQEMFVRNFDETSDKIFGALRLGTVLGANMSEKTAARTFISNALEGKPITPFRQSINRPVFYVDIRDVCHAYASFIRAILEGKITKDQGSDTHAMNFCWPKPVTILDLAKMVRQAVATEIPGSSPAPIRVVETGELPSRSTTAKCSARMEIGRASELLGIKNLINPRKSITDIAQLLSSKHA